MTLVLASGSPRRSELLARLGFPFSIAVSGVDEPPPISGQDPNHYALELARAKARAVYQTRPDSVVLGADTVVVRDATILGKPRDADDALCMLRGLRGRAHRVITGIVVYGPQARTENSLTTVVRMRDATDEELERYVAGGEPMDKAGSYAIQGEGRFLVADFQGCYENVMGLPLCRAVVALRTAGIELPCDAGARLDHHTDGFLPP